MKFLKRHIKIHFSEKEMKIVILGVIASLISMSMTYAENTNQDSQKPKILSHTISSLEKNTITVSFTTDQETQAVLWYGSNAQYTQFHKVEKSFSKKIQIDTFDNIESWRSYNYIIYVRNRSGLFNYVRASFTAIEKPKNTHTQEIQTTDKQQDIVTTNTPLLKLEKSGNIHVTKDNIIIENLSIDSPDHEVCAIYIKDRKNVVIQNVNISHAGGWICIFNSENIKINTVKLVSKIQQAWPHCKPWLNPQECKYNHRNKKPENLYPVNTHNNIWIEGSNWVSLDTIYVEKWETGVYTYLSPNVSVHNLHCKDIRGPYWRGQCVQFVRSNGAKLTNFYSQQFLTTSSGHDNIAAYESDYVYIANGLVDGNYSINGIGVIADAGSDNMTIKNVDAIHMWGAGINAWSGNERIPKNFTADHIRVKDGHCSGSWYGAEKDHSSGWLAFAAQPEAENVKITNSIYWNHCRDQAVYVKNAVQKDIKEEQFTLKTPPIDIVFPWEENDNTGKTIEHDTSSTDTSQWAQYFPTLPESYKDLQNISNSQLLWSHPTIWVDAQTLKDEWNEKKDGVYPIQRLSIGKSPDGKMSLIHTVKKPLQVSPVWLNLFTQKREVLEDAGYIATFKFYSTGYSGHPGKILELEWWRWWVGNGRFRRSTDYGTTGWWANLMRPTYSGKNYLRILWSHLNQKTQYGDTFTDSKSLYKINAWNEIAVWVYFKENSQTHGKYFIYLNNKKYLETDFLYLPTQGKTLADGNAIHLFLRLMDGGNPDEMIDGKSYTEYFRDMEIYSLTKE